MKKIETIKFLLLPIISLGLFACDGDDDSNNSNSSESATLAPTYSVNESAESYEVASELADAIVNYWNGETKMAKFSDLDLAMTFSYLYSNSDGLLTNSPTREAFTISADSLNFELRSSQGESYIDEEETKAEVKTASGSFDGGSLAISTSGIILEGKDLQGKFYYEEEALYCDASTSDAKTLLAYLCEAFALTNYDSETNSSIPSVEIPSEGKVYIDNQFLDVPYSLPLIDNGGKDEIKDFLNDIFNATSSWQLSYSEEYSLNQLCFELSKEDIISIIQTISGNYEDSGDYFTLKACNLTIYYGESLSAISLGINITDLDPTLWIVYGFNDESDLLPSGDLIISSSLSFANGEDASPLILTDEEKEAYISLNDCLVYKEAE